jgi:predicted GNAT family acetyltransferase
MNSPVDSGTVVHSETEARGAFRISDYAEMTYTRPKPGVMRVNHTLVEKAHRGQGLAHQLYFAMVDFARQNQRQVIAVCPFVIEMFEQHPENADVLAS